MNNAPSVNGLQKKKGGGYLDPTNRVIAQTRKYKPNFANQVTKQDHEDE